MPDTSSSTNPSPWLLVTPELISQKRALVAAKDPAALAFLKEAEADLSPNRWGGSKLIWNLALAYLLTTDARFADRAIAIMMTEVAKGQAGWSRDRGFDARDVLPALAIGYDWCFERLTADQANQLAAYMNGFVSWIWQNGYDKDAADSNYFWGFVLGTMFTAIALNRQDLLALAKGKLDAVTVYLGGPAKGGWLADGTSYGAGMITNLMLALAAYKQAMPIITFTREEVDLMRCRIACATPDFKAVVPFGDQADDTKHFINENDRLGPVIYQAFGTEELEAVRDWCHNTAFVVGQSYFWLAWSRFLFLVPPTEDPFGVATPPFYVAEGAGLVMAEGATTRLYYRVGDNRGDHSDRAANEVCIYRGYNSSDPVLALARIKSHSGLEGSAEHCNCLTVGDPIWGVDENKNPVITGYNRWGQWQRQKGDGPYLIASLEASESRPDYVYLRGGAGDPYVIHSSSEHLPLLTSWKREILFLREIDTAVILDRAEKVNAQSQVTLHWSFIGQPAIGEDRAYHSSVGQSVCWGQSLDTQSKLEVVPVRLGPTPGTGDPTSWRVDQTDTAGLASAEFLNVQQYLGAGDAPLPVSEVTNWSDCRGPRVGGYQMMFGLSPLFGIAWFDTDAHTFIMIGLEPGKSYFITEEIDNRQIVWEATVSEAGVLCFRGAIEGKRKVTVSDYRLAPPTPPPPPPPPPAPKPTIEDAMKLVSEVADAFDVEGDKMVDCYRAFTEKLDKVRDLLEEIRGE